VKIGFWTGVMLIVGFVGLNNYRRGSELVDRYRTESEVITTPRTVTSKPSTNRSSTTQKPDYTLLSYSNNSSCGSSRIQGITQSITARHCKVSADESQSEEFVDSPIIAKTGQSIRLPKPTVGPATTFGYHFGKKVTMNITVLKTDSCQALFSIDKDQPDENRYIQSGDSGSPIVQIRNGYPIVVGTMTAGLTKYQGKSVEGSRFRYFKGVFNYADCSNEPLNE
jgi:hypothetical protein